MGNITAALNSNCWSVPCVRCPFDPWPEHWPLTLNHSSLFCSSFSTLPHFYSNFFKLLNITKRWLQAHLEINFVSIHIICQLDLPSLHPQTNHPQAPVLLVLHPDDFQAVLENPVQTFCAFLQPLLWLVLTSWLGMRWCNLFVLFSWKEKNFFYHLGTD